ncbi:MULTISPECIES: ABC transporter permease [Ensifer]|jgi:rhamnose transport system permease protein|uniref:ABC transporter permease n=1 Tax=Ensifer canadensis TaxID=555315 RepID=A0AAW4FKH4_9HYPH|nr:MULTISPECIES: ABC transporter permease [Ensifer]AHK43382.1 putative ABC transporter, inner-membrane translocator [Ensifer adhaerens OV14]MDP9628446.1 rhamnose transport system permease protein [Ensifer adhaerens]KQU98127.1 branched-chain amino acid ABC transporter permease [Ensifer sp. Root31]KQW62837.1 branched-chain amino acid ABC transporter permease [Ensifer sp. Root1252]KQW84901.1 branched-chain amino acid ABC transporter permease [Ensifer sp. Root127]
MMAKLLKNRELLLVGAILVLVVLIAWRFPPFIAPTNLARVYNDTSILIILALGQMAVILTRCIDLSMAANLALSGMVAAMLNAAFPGLPIPVILLSAIALGAVLGMINGALVWKLDIPPIVVTLGTLTIYRGLIFLLTNGKWINAHQMSDAFKSFPRTDLAGIPVLSWLSVVTVAAIFLVISRTPLGRAFFAVGGNPHAAVYTGIDVGRTRFFAYCLSGTLAGLSGYLWVSRYAVAYVDIAAGFELDIIAACVIGGISIAGGIGSVPGAVLGALFLGVIKNALPVINISPFAQMAISGMVIITAVAVNARAERRKGRVILKKAEAV